MSSGERTTGMQLGSKIVLLIVLLLLAAQAATYAVMQFATQRSVSEQLHRELEVGERVWERFHETRKQQLLDRVSVLAADFGFREAVSSADMPTMQSALANAGGRIGADAAVLLDPQGKLQVDLWPADAAFDAGTLSALLAQATADGHATGVLVVNEQPYLLALVPVYAPRLVAWVGLAQEFGTSDVNEFAGIADMDASVLNLVGREFRVHASTLAISEQQRLLSMQHASGGTSGDVMLVGDDPRQPSARALSVSKAPAAPVFVLLQASRANATAPFDDLGRQVLLLSALVAAVALAVAVVVGQQVSRPIDRLARAALRIQRGEYAEPVIASSGGELGQLATAFNQMQAGIADREATILHQAGHDRLTGLPNRERALALLTATLADPTSEAGAVLSLDIVRFKEINDTLGHALGDRVLIEAGARLCGAVRSGDLVARLGADEFLLILSGVDAPTASRRAELLAETLRQPFDLGETSIRLDCCVGVAAFPLQGNEASTLLRRADIALHDAKQAHGGVVAYADGRDEQHLRQLRLISDLKRCVERNELSVVYQPKVNLVDGRVEHAEALLRWRHPDFGMVPPDEFIPLAERSGLIHALTLFVLDAAIGEVSRWQALGIEAGVAVNLSAEDLLSSDLPERVQTCLRRHSVSPVRLILEVTESAVMRDLETSLRTLHGIRRLGIRIAIDDFGTGQSSLAQLKRLPIDELKIDKSFVLSLAPGSDDELIVRSIIDLAHTLSMRVVAEGVETAVGLGLLRQHGCEVAQGYHLSRPLTTADFVAWVDARQSEAQLPSRDPAFLSAAT
ncbi:MAG: EAL domain-containing protein [Pseudomarimonas sp.]